MTDTRLPRSTLLLLALTVGPAGLAGCGLKGDLYLPDTAPQETPESLLPDDEEISP